MSKRHLFFLLFIAIVFLIASGVPTNSLNSSQELTAGQNVNMASGTTQTETIVSGRNVNMVSGDKLPGGDPWLQRQNEPSIAVSSRNPLHLLAGANDYRTVDMPISEGDLPGKTPTAMVGDAWLGVFTSYDGGESWVSTMLPGYPQDLINTTNPLKNYRTAADPVVRSGPNGLFYYSGIAFNRDTNLGVVFVARFIDNNNKEGGNTIQYIDTKIIASGTATKFLDKPWIAVDQPRIPFTNITIAGQTFPRHNVYIAYSAFSGQAATLGDIMFARSNDCGTTWGTPLKISTGNYAHQGATIAIKPVIGEVLVAWRRFGNTTSKPKVPDAIFVAQSFSRGLNFQSPVKVADIPPFDQPTTNETQSLPGTGPGFAFRTNSYPTITVDKSGHVYLAWSQRGLGPSGDARIVLSSSYLGTFWTPPQPVANLDENGLPFLGHQIMPSLSFAAGKLILLWYDQRHDISGHYYGYNNWILDSTPYRHTMDVWAAEADTDTYPNLAWNFTQVSRYLYSVLRDEIGNIIFDNNDNPIIFPVQFNCVNYPLFKGGHNPFDGDYIDVASSPTFRLDKWRNWCFNTDSPDSPVFHVAWTDNRDVRPPLDGNWTKYVPPDSTQDGKFITQSTPQEPRPMCDEISHGNEPGMRNQNIYTSRITWGIEAGSPTNDKPLNLPVGRAFVVFIKNNTESSRSYRLTIANQPTGGQASFLQFELLSTLDVNIAPFSTISRPVFINSTDPNASVTINIDEIDASGNVIAGGLKSSVLINGDPTNPNVPIGEETHNPNIVNQANPNIVNWYVNPNIVNPNIVNPNIVNPNIVNPNIVNPNIVNPNIVNPNIVNPNIVNPNIVNPDPTNPNIVNPNIVNPNIVNPNIVNPNIVNVGLEDLENLSITDVEWTVKNEGNATTSFTLKALAKKSPPEGVYAQLLVYKVHYTPAVAGAELSSDRTDIEACQLKQEPHHELVLNVVNPNIVNPNIVNPNIVNPNIVNSSIENATFSVAPGEEVIVDLRVLDTGVSQAQSSTSLRALSSVSSLQAFSAQEFIDSLGFAVTSQAVNSADAAQGIQTPPVAATTLVIGTSSLPDGVVGYSYTATLLAYGGTGSYTWSLNSGELPPGLMLSSGGLISGTPTKAGTYSFIVRVDSGGQFDTQRYSIYIDSDTTVDPLTITTASLPNGVQGYSYGATLEATGGVWPRTWSLASGSLPPSLSLDSGGVISGTPTATGTSSFTVRVTDKNGTTAFKSLSITINPHYYTISGTVSFGGTGLAGVVMNGLPHSPMTNSDGKYSDTVYYGWSGTVTPKKDGYTFTPPTQTYTDVTSNQTMNYTALTLPDLIVESLTHSPANPTTADLITFTAVVKNVGAGSAGASTLMFKIGGETPGAQGTLFSVPTLAPGASHTVTRQLTLDVAQSYMNKATADYNNEVAESNETNNTTTDSYAVTQALPDLIVESMTHNPASPTTADVITFTAVVKNVGLVAAGQSTLLFTIGGETPGLPQTLFTVQPLPPGGTATFQREAALIAQNYINHAEADYYKTVTESDEGNNTKTDTYTVTNAGQPDLIVETLTHSPANPKTADLITFTAVVKNLGPGAAGQSTLLFKIGGETPGAQGTLFSIPILAPGASYTVTRQLTLNVAQSYMNKATADYNNEVTESNEANNTTTDSYAVIALSTISGTVMYNGNPVSKYSNKQASFWARNNDTNQAIQITPTYNQSDGTYSIPNIPSGTYGIQVYIDDAEPINGQYFRGDFWGWTEPIIVNAPNPVNVNLICQKIMHLTSPIDNGSAIGPIPPPYNKHTSPITFHWDAIAEASGYQVSVDLYQDSPYESVKNIFYQSGIAELQKTIDLPVNETNQHYQFTLYAFNNNNVLVGQLMVVYTDGFGWDYRFKIIPGALASFVVDAPETSTAGTAFSVTITAKDSLGNTTTNVSGDTSLSVDSGTISPTSIPQSEFTDDGVWTGNVTLSASGNRTIAANNGGKTGSDTITMSAGALDHFDISAITSPQTAGVAFSITITAKDSGGNTVTNYTGTNTLGDTTGTINPTAAGAFSSGMWTGDVTISKAQTGVTISTTGDSKSGTSNSFDINARAATQILVETAADGTGTVVPAQSITSGEIITVFAISRDAGGNFVENVAPDSWSLINKTGGVVDSNLSPGWDSRVAFFISYQAGTAQIQVAKSGLTSTPSGILTVTAGALDHFDFDTISTQVAGVAFSITITAKDDRGNTVTSYTGTNTLSDPAATISPTTAGPFVNGTWTGDVTITNAQTGVKIYTSGDGRTGQSNAFDIAPPLVASISASPTSGLQPLVVNFTGGATGGITPYSFSWTFGDGGSSTAQNPSHTYSTGNYTATLTVTDSRGNKDSKSVAITVTGAASKLAFRQQPSNTAAGAAITPAVSVEIQDAAGNLVTTATNTVIMSIISNPGGGTLSGTISKAASAGVAIFNDLSIDKVGTGYKLRANSGSLTEVDSTSFNITPGSLDHFDFNPISSPRMANVGFSITITAKDAWENIVTSYADANTLSADAGTINRYSVPMSPSVTGAFLNGVWTGNITISSECQMAQIHTTGNTKTGHSNTFDVTSGLVFTKQPSNTPRGQYQTVIVQVRDQDGNPLPGFSVTMKIGNNPGGVTTQWLAVSNTEGIALFPIRIDVPGNGYTLVATATIPGYGTLSRESIPFDIL